MCVNLAKNEFRKRAKFALKNEREIFAQCKHYDILRVLEKIIKNGKFKRILIFIPLKVEPNLMLLRRKLCKNSELFVPFMADLSFKMVRLRSPFFTAKFGVKQPLNQNAFKKKIDLAVIPVIGVDGNLARIGHGKGYYDIFFGGLKYQPLIIFVSVKENFTGEIITEKHDLKGDLYITPRKIYTRGKNGRNFILSGGSGYRCCGGIFHRKKNK